MMMANSRYKAVVLSTRDSVWAKLRINSLDISSSVCFVKRVVNDQHLTLTIFTWSDIYVTYCDVQTKPTKKTFFTSLQTKILNPLTAKLSNLNFHPLEVVSRWRDPQLQVSENYSDLTKWRSTVFKFCWLNKKWKPEYMRHRRLKG